MRDGDTGPMTSGSPLTSLTPRETQVVALVLEGMTNKGIARQLGLSPDTVKEHLGRICRKLNLSDRFELISHMRDLPALRLSA